MAAGAKLVVGADAPLREAINREVWVSEEPEKQVEEMEKESQEVERDIEEAERDWEKTKEELPSADEDEDGGEGQ